MRVPLLPPGGPIKICPEAFTSGQIYVLKHGEAPGLVLQEGVRQGVDVLPGGLGAEAGPDGPGGQQKGYRYETQFFHRSAYFTQHDPQMSPPWVLQLEARSPPTYLPANMPFWSLLPMNAEYNTPSR